MEKMTTLNERTRTQIDVMKQSSALAKNQKILDEIGEDFFGNLTYKGKPIKRNIQSQGYGDQDYTVMTTNDGFGVMLFAPIDDSFLTDGREVADVRIIVNGEAFSLHELSALDGNAYAASMNRAILSPLMGMIWFATIHPIDARESLIIETFTSSGYQLEVDCYVD